MNTLTFNRRTLLAAALVSALIAGFAGYGLALWRQSVAADVNGLAAPLAGTVDVVSANGVDSRKPLYWYDPMKPDTRFDKPGKSPFMDMDLVPRYAEDATAGGVKIDPRLTQSLGFRLASVTRERVASSFDAVGTLGLDERDVAIVQSRTAGFVEKVYSRAPGDLVVAGSPLVDLLVPEWAGAQQEFLAVRAYAEDSLTAAARHRLLLLGMPEALVREVERSGRAQPVMTITSPIGGVIQELMVRTGMSLGAGMTLARINGLSTVWLEVALPEVQAALATPGRAVRARFAAYPGEVFEGRVKAVLPETVRETRTLRLRIELPNPNGKLKAGLFATATIVGAREDALVVPSEAVIRTGQRAVVFVAGEKPGSFSPVTVEIGPEIGDKLVVLKGLIAGQQVVASGQFLIDSEASMAGRVVRSAAGQEAAK